MRRRTPAPMAGGSAEAVAASARRRAELAALAERASLTLGMLIAVAIGLHNFSEGLAIGVSARGGEVALATTLIIGFALHNATEGFGIVGPLGGVRPSWRWIILAGLIGGGPTFVGTLVGYRVTSPALEIAFYTLAAGAILYVVGQLWNSRQPPPRRAARAPRPHGRLPDRPRVRPGHHVRRRLTRLGGIALGPDGGEHVRREAGITASSVRSTRWRCRAALRPGLRRRRTPHARRSRRLLLRARGRGAFTHGRAFMARPGQLRRRADRHGARVPQRRRGELRMLNMNMPNTGFADGLRGWASLAGVTNILFFGDTERSPAMRHELPPRSATPSCSASSTGGCTWWSSNLEPLGGRGRGARRRGARVQRARAVTSCWTGHGLAEIDLELRRARRRDGIREASPIRRCRCSSPTVCAPTASSCISITRRSRAAAGEDGGGDGRDPAGADSRRGGHTAAAQLLGRAASRATGSLSMARC